LRSIIIVKGQLKTLNRVSENLTSTNMKNLQFKESVMTCALKKQLLSTRFITTLSLFTIASTAAQSQTTSYNLNAIPIVGVNNSGFGVNALVSNTTGTNNAANGINALRNNTSGIGNTGSGALSLIANTTGNNNTGMGYAANGASITGNDNSAFGSGALKGNGAYENTAVGSSALLVNLAGHNNAAVGFKALTANASGKYNVGIGSLSLIGNTNGGNNTALGYSSMSVNTTGVNNTALGFLSNTSTGILINATAIGANTVVNASNKVRIGDASVTVIEGQVAFTPSDARFKENIKEEVKGLEFINRLRPVVYNFNAEKFQSFLVKNMTKEEQAPYMAKNFSDATAIRQSGFLAQEVEKAAKETGYNFNALHTPVDENDNYSIAYGQFVVPLVKAVQELDQQKSEQDLKIEKLMQELEMQKQVIQKLQDQAMISAQTESNLKKLNYSLEQNEPNPFSQETVIKYTLPKETIKAYLAIYDLTGKQINTFDLNDKGAITITTEKLVSGIYIYTIIADNTVLDTKRMHVSKKQ
jgi:trimeric autotransporter adhesin